jgi:glycerophosphoryl diester phosphodiesterase
VAGAHQGGIFGPTPNTLAAFEEARKAGADIVEMDLRLSKDGIPVVFHDETLDSRTFCLGKVSDYTLAQLKDCQFRSSYLKIATYEEALQWANGRVIVDAEFKESSTIKPALDLVKKYNAHSWTYFQAQGNREKYRIAREYDPEVALLYVVNHDDDLKWALDQKDDALLIIELNEDSRTQARIQAIHAAGKLVTEDSWHFTKAWELFGASCAEAYSQGIDIPISNRPQGCVEQRDERRKTSL